MDQQDLAITRQWAQRLCDGAAWRGEQMGLEDGIVTVMREYGEVTAVLMEVFQAKCPHRRDPRLVGSCDCIALAEAQHRFEQTMRERLEHCGVPFGRLAFVFREAGLRWVNVTQNFRMDREEEIAELGRIHYVPQSGYDLNGRRSRGTPGGGNGRHR